MSAVPLSSRALLLGLVLLAVAHAPAHATICSSRFLYVWAGSSNTTATDSLFTISTCPNEFGKIKAITPTAYNSLEPHHMGMSADGKTLGAGGLLAALSGAPGIHFFDLSKPNNPSVIPNIPQPKKSAITDAFLPLPEGGFLVTMMGSSTGGSPGRVARYNARNQLVAELPVDDNFGSNPGANFHGIAANFATSTLVTGDFIVPSSTLKGNGPIVARSTMRVFNITTGKQTAVIDLQALGFSPAGIMDVQAIGTTGLFYGGSALDGNIFLVNTNVSPPTATRAYDSGPTAFGLMKVFKGGRRMAVSSFTNSSVTLFDTTNPYHPVPLSTLSFGAGNGGHFVSVNNEENLMAVATYFLEEGPGGLVHAAGDMTVRFIVLDAAANTLTPHPKVPVLRFDNIAVGNGLKASFKPHGLAWSPLRGDWRRKSMA